MLMDAGYGNDTGLRTDITALSLRYVEGIGPNTSVWPPGEAAGGSGKSSLPTGCSKWRAVR